jgi:hypothetical protein
MRRAQVVVCEADGRLAELLRVAARTHGWWLREVRHLGSVLETLQAGGVLVLKVGRDLEGELSLLETVAWRFPEIATVVIGDGDHVALANLAWDLGARLVLLPPLLRIHLPDVVHGFLAAGSKAGAANEIRSDVSP